MANINTPFGFSQRAGTGSTPSFETNEYPIIYTNATGIYTGDPTVIDPSTGYLAQATASTAPIVGIFQGCSYVSVSQQRRVWLPYWPGADAVTGTVVGYVVDDPNSQWLVQCDGNGPITQATVGANYQFALGTGNTASGRSGASLVGNSNAVTATLPFKLIGLVTTPPGVNGTDISSTYNQVIVQANNWMKKTTTGIV